ncbi:MAG TPA: ABC-type transport auxiliary lipoprotein family protein [Steroidobacteraceae bacterium]|nr:ABC-type transport auxiliary lipoprotein family protein [Steroidobacteraceae bacterium]
MSGGGSNGGRALQDVRAPLIGLLSLAALAACTGSIFRSSIVPPAVYELSAPAPSPAAGPAVAAAPAAAANGPSVDLAVLKPRVHSGLDDDLVHVLYPDHRLDHLAAARWSGPLDEMLQDLILEAFRSRSSALGVHADGSVFGAGYWLEVDVDDFQAVYAARDALPVIHVHAVVRLGASSDRRILGRFELDSRENAAANRVDAIVEAYNRALDDVLTELVNRTLAAIAAKPEA